MLSEIKQINMDRDDIDGFSQAVLLYHRNQQQPQPMVVIAHGGPHANAINTRLSVKLLLLRGFAVLLVNFTGSLGYGQTNIDQLLSKIGHKDAKQFDYFIQQSIDTKLIDKSRVAVFGGSYGGYLATRLP